MNIINVLANEPIGKTCLDKITAISSRIKVIDVSKLSLAEQKGDYTSKDKYDALLAKAQVIYGSRIPKDVITRSPRLKWIQSMSAGVDRDLDSELLRSSVIMTNVSGIHSTPIGEFVLGLMLMFAKQSIVCFSLKQEKQWKRLVPTVLRSKTVGIVGLGSIGREVARLSKSFGMRVVAIRRTSKRITKARNVDMMLPRQYLNQLLSESDFVVLTLPLTSETHKLIGEEELRTMKSTAYLINIARGKVVDEEALIRALDTNRIAGAGLDVFAIEPLPIDSKLWKLPNVIYSPHAAGNMDDYNMQATDLFCENLRRYLNNKKLLNIVDKKKGY